ncbi:hypothetical protein [Nocardia arthritidis]|uniref:Uncharacterized protein n=1 Tax=Nocardia arthritidis TaxID=228602 RepID=A0A6G9YED3_9NOCA|nr:hypothetical protein [Nocardia arthritidis]QIS11548.1 hypothetical protein F5544_18370 [Nocardia arthritidis]
MTVDLSHKPGRHALDGEFDADRDERHYHHTDGAVTVGSADPSWWHGVRPGQIAQRIEAYQPSR